MTDEERTRLKAEIVAELGTHLDEHYVKTADLETLSKGISDTLGGGVGKLMDDLVGSIDDRLRQVEMWVALEAVHRTVDVTDGNKWMFLASVRDSYAKKVRRGVVEWFKKGPPAAPEGAREYVEIHLDKLRELFRMIDPD